nr:LOW QUALITY PROTEIN: coiled-coil domain-containing protein 65-like [Salvelinus alpinus]
MTKKSAKKGGGKQAGMTEEERLLYMQQRAQAEEEMSERKEDVRTKFLKVYIQEFKPMKSRTAQCNLLSLFYCQSFLNKLQKEEHSKTFERVLDRKDSVIKSIYLFLSVLQCLVCNLSEAEQQSAQVLRSHLQCVDCLLALQKGRLASLEQQWDIVLEGLSYDFNSERSFLTPIMQGTVEDLWRQFQQALGCYNEATENRLMAIESLWTLDQHSPKEIDTQMRRLQKMQVSVGLQRLLFLPNIHTLRLSYAYRQHTCTLYTFTLMHVYRLLASYTFSHLCDVVDKGERLLSLAEMCHKLETEHKKVLPFYTSHC